MTIALANRLSLRRFAANATPPEQTSRSSSCARLSLRRFAANATQGLGVDQGDRDARLSLRRFAANATALARGLAFISFASPRGERSRRYEAF